MSAPMECRRIWVSIAFFTVLATSKGNEDTFSEELLIKPLNSGHILMHFQFTTKSDVELLDKTSCKFCFNRLNSLIKFKLQNNGKLLKI